MNEQRAGAMDEMTPAVSRAAMERMLGVAVTLTAEPVYACADCQDAGVLVRFDEQRRANVARPCACQLRRAAAGRIRRAGVPAKYEDARFLNFSTDRVDPTVREAALVCRRAVDELLLAHEGVGLLLWGSCGTGKTRLAVSALLVAMERYSLQGRFWDVRRLLLQIRSTFGRGAAAAGEDSEAQLVEEFARVPVLVIDDLGCERMSEWEATTIAMLLNERYNDSGRAARLTLVTTNYANLGAGEGRMVRGVREETLGDRLGTRTFSRLQEMFRALEMCGPDMRREKRGSA